METLVIIPAKNESQKIVEVIGEVKTAIGSAGDVLVVDDGSTDNTFEVARLAGAITLRHLINRGQGAALRTGISYALKQNYNQVVFFDADGQMRAEEIPLMLERLKAGDLQVVLGSRFLGKIVDMPLSKLITLKLALLFTRLTSGLKLTDTHNGFQAWTRVALQKLALRQDRQAYASELLSEIKKNNLRYQELPVTIIYSDYSKQKGQSIFNAFNIVWDLFIKR
ncbi:MAG: glycosyltransferase family 2 protein [Patescibacteria group bacterium]